MHFTVDRLSAWRRRLCLLAVAGLALCLASTSAAAQSVITNGHWDFETAYVNGEWEPHWHNHELELEFDFSDAIMRGVFDSTDSVNQFDYPFARPAGSQWDFTGVSAGHLIYAFPSNDPGEELPYLGIAAEEVEVGVFVSDRLTLTFNGVASGPGEFSLYTFVAGNPRAFFSSAGDSFTFNGDNSLLVNVGSHSHYHWAFTEQGLYELIFEASGDLVAGGSTSSGDFSVFFQVVPEPSGVGVFAMVGLLALRRRRTA